MEASSWLLEARTNELENQEGQRKVMGVSSSLSGRKNQETLGRSTLQPSSVAPIDGDVVGIHSMTGLRPPCGGQLVLRF